MVPVLPVLPFALSHQHHLLPEFRIYPAKNFRQPDYSNSTISIQNTGSEGLLMDTTEELNGTYFYNGHANVTQQELFWLIFLEGFADRTGWGVETAAMILAGQPILPKRVVLGSKVKRTSIASKLSRRILKNVRLPWGMRIETSVMGHSRATNKLGAIVGRAVPHIGYAQAVVMLAVVARETRNKYNIIVRPKDRIEWAYF